jgi:hypothetical protein
MAKPQKKITVPTKGLDEIELHPDAWKRFENFVKAKVPTRPAKPTASRPKATSRKRAKKA